MTTSFNLDEPQTFATLDPTGLGGRIRSLPGQCKAAWQQTRTIDVPETETPTRHVVIAGMGGSAIAGDLVADLISASPAIPITVVRGFHLPFAVNEGTLIIVCSFSGNTKETLSVFSQAAQSAARVVAITGGGTLARQAKQKRIPTLHVNAPGEPRSAVGYHLTLILGLLNRLQLVDIDDADVDTAVGYLERRVAELGGANPAKDNPAKQLALELEGSIPLVYGGGLFSGVARRWKTQLNENAKMWAFYEYIPELLHNSVESFRTLPPSGAAFKALLLQPNTSTAELDGHFRAASQLLNESNIPNRLIRGGDCPPLAQLLDMLVLGDYVSYYLALLQGIDPSPTPGIDAAKELLVGY